MEANDRFLVLEPDLDFDRSLGGDIAAAPAATVAALAWSITLTALALIRWASASFLASFPGRSNSTMSGASSGSAGRNK